MLSGNILITGGAGFLGRGIMRRAKREGWPANFTVYSRDEQKHMAVRDKYPARYVIGDITDDEHLIRVMIGQNYVIHTAALKYIPEGERNPWECVRVNVDGSRSVISAANALGVKRVVLISTDKAAHPANTYGMTKALIEKLVHETSEWPDSTELVACRYGNVVGSTGSVWPVFKRQAKEFGRLQLTDSTMTRFYISIEDAVDLILASLDAPAGNVVIPQPRASYMREVAESVANYLGIPGKIDVVGPRPGEKTHEDMLGPGEADRTVKFGKYYLLLPPGSSPQFGRIDNVAGSMMVSNNPHSWISGNEFIEMALESESV